MGDQVLFVVLLDVRVTLPGLQNVVGPPAVIVGVAGAGLTVTEIEFDVPIQPFPSVTVVE